MTHKTTSPKIIQRAKELRQNGSVVEKTLWKALRVNTRNKHFKFRYQHPISNYIVDFACLPAKLVIEIDGPSHEATIKNDKTRQHYIENLGYEFLRFSNHDVINNLEGIISTIIDTTTIRLDSIYKNNPPPR